MVTVPRHIEVIFMANNSAITVNNFNCFNQKLSKQQNPTNIFETRLINELRY